MATVQEQLKALSLLQEIDLRLDQLQASRTALPLRLKELDTRLTFLTASATQKNQEIKDHERGVQQASAALELNRERLQRASAKLGDVTNNDQYQAANREIEQLKKFASSVELQTAKSTQDLEVARRQIAEMDSERATTESTRQEKLTEIESEQSTLDIQINELTSQRPQYVGQIPPGILSTYTKVRGAKAGLGIAPAAGGRCRGCNMLLPPQLFNLVLKNQEIHQCPTCHRILLSENLNG